MRYSEVKEEDGVVGNLSVLDNSMPTGIDTYIFIFCFLGTFFCFASYSNGSATSEDLFWKLDALQMFVFDLHWPEPEFASHLEQRLKLMATDMIEACVKRYSWNDKLKIWRHLKINIGITILAHRGTPIPESWHGNQGNRKEIMTCMYFPASGKQQFGNIWEIPRRLSAHVVNRLLKVNKPNVFSIPYLWQTLTNLVNQLEEILFHFVHFLSPLLSYYLYSFNNTT